MIFQGSSNAFNPYYTVRQIIGEPLQNYHKMHGAEQEQCIVSMLERVGLDGSYLRRYSHELSGGQRQRVGIARALILEPEFVVCDEAVSSIDFALKKQILKLLVDLKKKNGTTYLFISHDMAAVKAVCDRIMVMYLGNILEILPSADAETLHPYTQALMAATLEPDPTVRREKKVLFKEDGAQTIPKAGCVFQSRCLYARDKCTCQRPELEEVSDGHFVACHYMKKKKTRRKESEKRVISILAALLCMATLLSACGKVPMGRAPTMQKGKRKSRWPSIKTVLWRNWMPQPITGPTSCIK